MSEKFHALGDQLYVDAGTAATQGKTSSALAPEQDYRNAERAAVKKSNAGLG